MEEEPELPPEHLSPVELTMCQSCGRNFNPDILARHEVICIKNKTKGTRKPFDTARHRIRGTELEAYLDQKKYKRTPADQMKMIAYERQAMKKKQWKRKHDDFISTIRTAREYDAAIRTGHSLPPPAPSAPNPDYVQCPYCKRRFQEHAAERHIPFCKEQSNRIERKTNCSILNKREKYKPPVLRKRSGTGGLDLHNPPGSSLVRKNTNFSATYTVSENGDHEYQPPRIHDQRLLSDSRSRKPLAQAEGMAAHNLPGNTPRVRKPYPPSKIAPPGVRTRMVHIKRPENGAQQEISEGGYPNGYSSQPDEVDYHHQSGNSNRNPFTQNSGPLRAQRHGSGKISGYHLASLVSLQKEYSESSPSDTSIDQKNSCISSTQAYVTSTKPNIPPQDRIHSDTSINGGRNTHLNIHGMTMSKFCYECGCKFPVPQAKYCCECGTKRI